MLAAIVPLGEVADEPAQVLRADSLLHGEWIGHRAVAPGPDGRPILREGVVADDALLSVIVSIPRPVDTRPGRIDGARLLASRHLRLGRSGFHDAGSIAAYFPAFYLPAAAGLAAVKLTGGGAFAGFMAARLCNLAAALGMGTAALSLARRGRPLLFATLLLPSCVALAASASQDGVLIAAAALAAALASRLAPGEHPPRRPAFWGTAVLVGCIALAKPPYLPLVALLFLPLRRSGRLVLPAAPAVRLATALAIALLVLGWTWLTVHHAAVPVWRQPEEAGPLWPGRRPAVFGGTDMAAQLRVLTARPWRFLTLPWQAVAGHPGLLWQAIGVLGWLNLVLPARLTACWAAALLAACLAGSVRRRPGLPLAEAVALLLAMAAAAVLICLSQYLSFTPVGHEQVAGVQGRYLLPLLPLLALALPGHDPPPGAGRILLVPAAAAALLGLLEVPVAVIAFYYVGG